MTIKHWRFALITWMIFIFIASTSLLSSENTEKVLTTDALNYIVRKMAHIIEFAILAYLWFRSLPAKPQNFRSRILWSALLSTLYAISDEWHQSFVPERLGIWTDVVWDATGVVLLCFVLCYIYRWGTEQSKQTVLGISVVE